MLESTSKEGTFRAGTFAGKELTIRETEHLEIEGRIAVALVERWGMVVAVEGGEDSAGRAKLKAATPKEVVDRAVETAELFMAKVRALGWVHVTESLK